MLAPVAYGASETGDPDPDRIIFVPFVTICRIVLIVISLKALYKGRNAQPGLRGRLDACAMISRLARRGYSSASLSRGARRVSAL